MARHFGWAQVRLMRPLGNHAVSGRTVDVSTEIAVPPRAVPALPAANALTALPAPTAGVGDVPSDRMSRARLEQSLCGADTTRPARDHLLAPSRVSMQNDIVQHRARCALLTGRLSRGSS